MIRLEADASIKLAHGDLFINLKTSYFAGEVEVFKEINHRIENIEKQRSLLIQSKAQKKTHGGKRFRMRQRSHQDKIDRLTQKIFMLNNANKLLPDYLSWGFLFNSDSSKSIPQTAENSDSESHNSTSSSSSSSNDSPPRNYHVGLHGLYLNSESSDDDERYSQFIHAAMW